LCLPLFSYASPHAPSLRFGPTINYHTFVVMLLFLYCMDSTLNLTTKKIYIYNGETF